MPFWDMIETHACDPSDYKETRLLIGCAINSIETEIWLLMLSNGYRFYSFKESTVDSPLFMWIDI